MVVIQFNNSCVSCRQFVAIVLIIPADAALQIDVAPVEVDGQQLCLELVGTDVVVAFAFHVDVQVVATESEV